VDGQHSQPALPDGAAGTALHEWPLVSALEFGSLPTAVGSARAHTRTILAEWGLAALISDAEMLVSELLTNALEASWRLNDRPPIALRLLANHDRLLIEAWDQDTGSCHLHPQEPRSDEDHGRGLMVVDALSQRWGVRRTSVSHKVVWAELVVPYEPISPVGLPRRMPPHELAERAPPRADARTLERTHEALRRLR
jgi:anti-sigma regulatory factor (Ser/Thr protein kinase)